MRKIIRLGKLNDLNSFPISVDRKHRYVGCNYSLRIYLQVLELQSINGSCNDINSRRVIARVDRS